MPQVFGRYELRRLLAQGESTEVWLARETGKDADLVVRRFHPALSEDLGLMELLLAEARKTARLDHPNIARVHGHGDVDGVPYLAMEYVPGEPLNAVMRGARSQGQPLPPALALHIAASVCAGLEHAHGMQVVHRSIRPETVLIGFDGAVKLIGFGRPWVVDQRTSITRAGTVKNIIDFVAPEQVLTQPVDGRTDLFSLAVVLYTLLTGVHPFKQGSEVATLNAVLQCEPAPPSQVGPVPPLLDAVLLKALARAPTSRYPDASRFRESLELSLQMLGWTGEAGPEPLARWMRALFARSA
jgi:serine/threonine protein kinase